MSRNGRPGRADRGSTKDRWHGSVPQHRHLASILHPINSGPRLLTPPPPPNSIMPAHRRPSTARSHAARRPYKSSIIVISSDEGEEPSSVPKRGSRKPKRSRAEGEILEIIDETPVKVEEPELESLRRQCHELEQACSPIAARTVI